MQILFNILFPILNLTARHQSSDADFVTYRCGLSGAAIL